MGNSIRDEIWVLLPPRLRLITMTLIREKTRDLKDPLRSILSLAEEVSI